MRERETHTGLLIGKILSTPSAADLPATQSVHSEAPEDAPYFPEGQEMHVADETAPDDVPYFPTVHEVQLDAPTAPTVPEKVPTGHGEHACKPPPLRPSPLNSPAMQAGGSGHCTQIHRKSSVFRTDRDEEKGVRRAKEINKTYHITSGSFQQTDVNRLDIPPLSPH